ncbi:FH2 domain-containing protein 1-like [Ciconia maguari]
MAVDWSCRRLEGGRLRALHWEPVPAARVRGRRSVWAPRAAPPPLDLPRLRLLFREPRGAAAGQRPPSAATLLDPKRSLALGVFLKQVKRPVRQIVQDIQEGIGAPYGAEKLLELSRMLPGAAEVARLRSFPGSPCQLADPELFMLLLTEVPSYAQRLELLVLKEDFFPRLSALRGSIQTLTDAAVELLECEELHTILHLILSAGNHLNSGGYAGSAAGFRLASLLKLPDTKANEPGMDLLHFVAMEAARVEKSLLDFPAKLQHVGPASRIEAAEVDGELRRLAGRLAGGAGAGRGGAGAAAAAVPARGRGGAENRGAGAGRSAGGSSWSGSG